MLAALGLWQTSAAAVAMRAAARMKTFMLGREVWW